MPINDNKLEQLPEAILLFFFPKILKKIIKKNNPHEAAS